MAKCQDCGKEMLDHVSCEFPYLMKFIGQRKYKRIKYGEGDEINYIDVKTEDYQYCHDCGCKVGDLHHNGCDMERCPICNNQLISCDCKLAYLHK